MDRRNVMMNSMTVVTTSLIATTATSFRIPLMANADDDAVNTGTPKVDVLAGATGLTGRILERLAENKSIQQVIGGVRNVDKAVRLYGNHAM
jgi:hypothetical protein